MLNLTGKQINLIHALLVGPLLVYVGMNKGNVDKRIFTVLLVLGVMATLYHGQKYLQ